MTDVPETHPRYESLRLRDAVVAGVDRGVTSVHGLIAHGRGEAFDYLLGERTHDFARDAIAAAAAMLAAAQRPVLSVNGNAAALAPDGLVALAEALSCPLEVNLFHKSRERERAIEELLVESGAARVLLPDPDTFLEGIDSNRRYVHPEGIHRADAGFRAARGRRPLPDSARRRQGSGDRRSQPFVAHGEAGQHLHNRQRRQGDAPADRGGGGGGLRPGREPAPSRGIRQRPHPGGGGAMHEEPMSGSWCHAPDWDNRDRSGTVVAGGVGRRERGTAASAGFRGATPFPERPCPVPGGPERSRRR